MGHHIDVFILKHQRVLNLVVPFCTHISKLWDDQLLHILTIFSVACHFYLSYSSRFKVLSHCIRFSCWLIMLGIFSHAYWPVITLFCKSSQLYAHFKNFLFFVFFLNILINIFSWACWPSVYLNFWNFCLNLLYLVLVVCEFIFLFYWVVFEK